MTTKEKALALAFLVVGLNQVLALLTVVAVGLIVGFGAPPTGWQVYWAASCGLCVALAGKAFFSSLVAEVKEIVQEIRR